MRWFARFMLVVALLGSGFGMLSVHAKPFVHIVEYPLPKGMEVVNAITSGADGNLWFPYGDGIARMTPQGSVTQFRTSDLYGYRDLTAGPDGNLWGIAVDRRFGSEPTIDRITLQGKVTRFFVPPNTEPYRITAGPDGNLWFTEWWTNHIGRITPEGDITLFPIPLEGVPGAITAGPDHKLWFHFSGPRIGRVTPKGAMTFFDAPMDGAGYDITADSEGNLWLTGGTGGDIRRLTPAGDFTAFDLPDEMHGAYSITLGADDALWFTAGYQMGRVALQGDFSTFDIPTGSPTAPRRSRWDHLVHRSSGTLGLHRQGRAGAADSCSCLWWGAELNSLIGLVSASSFILIEPLWRLPPRCQSALSPRESAPH